MARGSAINFVRTNIQIFQVLLREGSRRTPQLRRDLHHRHSPALAPPALRPANAGLSSPNSNPSVAPLAPLPVVPSFRSPRFPLAQRLRTADSARSNRGSPVEHRRSTGTGRG